MRLTKKRGPVAEIVKIIVNQRGCHLSADEIERKFREMLRKGYVRNAKAERRRDDKIRRGDLKEDAAKLQKALDMALSLIGPEVTPERAERLVTARLEDALIYRLDRKRGLTGDILHLMELRSAARDIAVGKDGGPAADMIEPVIFSRQGPPPLPPAAILYVGSCMDFWYEMTGAECNIWPEGRDSGRAGKVKETPAARYLQQCYRLIGNEKSLDAIRKDVRKHLDI